MTKLSKRVGTILATIVVIVAVYMMFSLAFPSCNDSGFEQAADIIITHNEERAIATDSLLFAARMFLSEAELFIEARQHIDLLMVQIDAERQNIRRDRILLDVQSAQTSKALQAILARLGTGEEVTTEELAFACEAAMSDLGRSRLGCARELAMADSQLAIRDSVIVVADSQIVVLTASVGQYELGVQSFLLERHGWAELDGIRVSNISQLEGELFRSKVSGWVKTGVGVSAGVGLGILLAKTVIQ